MPTIKVTPGKLGMVLRADGKNLPAVISTAMHMAAQRARTRMVAVTPVDRGMLKNAWRVVKLAQGGYELLNDAPYAGVMERGIRPGQKFGRLAHAAIKGWVLRKLLFGQKLTGGATLDSEAERITWAIIKKMEKFGRAGKFFVKKEMDDLSLVCARMVTKAVKNYYAAGGGTGPGGGKTGGP